MKKIGSKKFFLLLFDVLLIPGLFFCEKLSDIMLSQYSVCTWVRLGGQCITCGGTHFVNTLLNGKIAEAFSHNQFLFLILVLLLVSWILLHLDWLFGISWAKKVLSWIFSIPTLIILLEIMMIFFLIRNIPVLIRITELLGQYF